MNVSDKTRANTVLVTGPRIVRAEGVVHASFVDVPSAVIHEADIAAVAVAALTTEHAESFR